MGGGGGGGGAERQTQQLCAFVCLSRAREEDVELIGMELTLPVFVWSGAESVEMCFQGFGCRD